MEQAGLKIEYSLDWTDRVRRTWQICDERVQKSRIRWLAPLFGRNSVMFLDRFSTILRAYDSGAMQYGCFVRAQAGFELRTLRRWPPQIHRSRYCRAPSGHCVRTRNANRLYGHGAVLVFVLARRLLHAGNWFVVDGFLALQFAVVHSLILLPAMRSRISQLMPSQLYGSVFAVATCATLWPMFLFWRASTHTLWEATGWAGVTIQACFYLSWVALFLSLRISGFGYQTGWTQWLYWYRREPLPRRPLSVNGPYRWMRHPAYLSFMGLIWFTPHMTADHAILTATWTAYIFVGSYLKDRRLLFYTGDAYRNYAPARARLSRHVLRTLGKMASGGNEAPADSRTESRDHSAESRLND